MGADHQHHRAEPLPPRLDAEGQAGFVFTFPSFTLKAGASVTVHTGTGKASATNRYYGYTGRRYVWNNTGDTAYLRDSKRVLKDSWAFKDKGSASSVSR